MARNPEKITPPTGGRKDKREWINKEHDRFRDTHYSEKPGHKKRSDHHPGDTGKGHR